MEDVDIWIMACAIQYTTVQGLQAQPAQPAQPVQPVRRVQLDQRVRLVLQA